jgi:transposase
MARRIHLEPHLSTAELERRYRQAKDGTLRAWWQIIWLLARGQTAKDIAVSTGYSRYWIGQLAKRYNEHGPQGMSDRRRTDSRRAPLLLSAAQQDELRAALRGPAPEGQLWSGRVVAEWMAARLGRPVRYQVGWAYLIRLGGRPRAPRPRHAAADPAAQEAFKKR